MIRGSFIFLDKIGKLSEQRIWNQGVHSWEDFLDKKDVDGVSSLRKGYYDRKILTAKKHLADDNAPYFRDILPNSEQYRLYNYFKDDTCFLDIETSGYYGSITMIGLYDGNETKTLVKGFNLDKDLLLNELNKYKLIVTYNGGSFDLPVIKKYFDVPILSQIPHMDLRHVCSRLGLNGGLKGVEKAMGIKRVDEVEGMAGEDAVYLWQQWRATGNRKYLDLLKLYNDEDIINLKTIADKLVPKLWQKVKGGNR